MASSSHLKPGEKGKIHASIDTFDFSGRISKRVKVISNDPKRRVVVLTLYAIIK